MKNLSVLLLLICLSASTTSIAQNLSDSLQFLNNEFPQSLLLTNFDKQLNTFRLRSGLNFNKRFGKFQFFANENLTSTLIRSTENNVRSEHSLFISSAYKINNNIDLGLHIINNILTDSRDIGINKAAISSITFYTKYSPKNDIYLSPFLGYSNNNQIGQTDYGLIYGFEGLMNDYLLSDIKLNSMLRLVNEDILPRKNSVRAFNVHLENNFDKNIQNSFTVKYSRNRKDFYFLADSSTASIFNVKNNIQSRIETDFYFEDRLGNDNALANIKWNIAGRLLWRNIDRDTRYKTSSVISSSLFDTRINELRIEMESLVSYTGSFFKSVLRILYNERDEKNTIKNFEDNQSLLFEEKSKSESRKNNNAKRISLSLSGNLNLSESDKINFSLYQNKLRYNTPSSENFDDRDELLSILRLQYVKTFTPFFEGFVNIDATISQTVYIFSEKSSNNNINRVFSLSAGGKYSGKMVKTTNSFSVSANYTVFDFEDINPNFKSFSFRQFTARDSTSIKFSRRLSLLSYNYIKLSEQGNLQWNEFTTTPTRYLEEIFSETKLIVKSSRLSYAIGLRIFLLNTYNYRGAEKVIDSKFLSIAPITEIKFELLDVLYFRLYGWYEFITLNNGQSKQETNLSMQMNYYF
ncbi:MAG: hypothetical protein IH949_02860 [Bacteroidetes bacterium]|nr:hypothetical protein [Bacteroidota bacterium]